MRLLVKLFCFLLVAPCLAAPEAYVIDGVAARVNERVVTIGEVLVLMRPVHQKLVARYKGKELMGRLEAAYQSALDDLVARALILDAYAEQERQLPDWVIQERMDKIIHEMFDGDRTRLLTALERDGLTVAQWQEQIRDQIAVASMRGAMVDQHVSVSPEEVRARYKDDKDQYAMPEQVKLRMIVIKKQATGDPGSLRERVKKLRERLAGGYSFSALARDESEGSRAEEGGDWGWIEPRMLRSELAEAAGRLQPGKMSDVIETKREYYIVKLEGRREASVQPFEDVQPEIEQALRQAEAEKRYRAWVDRLKKNAYIKIFDVKLFE